MKRGLNTCLVTAFVLAVSSQAAFAETGAVPRSGAQVTQSEAQNVVKHSRVVKGKIASIDLKAPKPQLKLISAKTGKERRIRIAKSTVILHNGKKVDAGRLKVGDNVKIIRKKKRHGTAKSIEILV